MVLIASSICVSHDRGDRRLKIKNPSSTARHANDPRVKTGLVYGISVCGACLSICMRCFFKCLRWRGEVFSIGRFCGSDLSQPINSDEICAKMEGTQGVIGLGTL
jgi:hypothetical protein